MSFWSDPGHDLNKGFSAVKKFAGVAFPTAMFANLFAGGLLKKDGTSGLMGAASATANSVAGAVGAPAPFPSPTSGPDSPGPASPGTTPDSPMPTPASPNPTESAAMAAKRRLAALRMGLLSTITTSGMGVAGAPSILQPSATATGTGLKTALGQ